MLFSCIALIFMASGAFAQENKKERGYNGRITIKELLSKCKRGEAVEGYIIDGDDIIKIIRRTRYAIKIKDSIIEDGLDFHKLPKIPLDKIKLPKNWDKEKRDDFIKKRRNFDYPFIHNVKNEIQIIWSEIRSKKENDPSVQAQGAFFYNKVNFNGTTFIKKADFSQANFSGDTYFLKAIFKREADFFKTTFLGQADFLQAYFNKKALFYEATFNRRANFQRAEFSKEEDSYFSSATFIEEAVFSWAIFSGNAYFKVATFIGEANFSRAILKREANFSWATFHELAYFKESEVNKLFLDATLFTKYADFRETMIGKLHYKCISPAIVKGRIDFRNSSISEMHFQDIIFENDVDFSDVKFGISLEEGKTDGKLATVFRYVTFESDAYFIRAEFHSDTVFERIKFKGDANFTDIAFKDFKHRDQKKFSLSYFTFKRLLLSMDDLPDIQYWVRDDKDRIRSFVDVEDNKANKTGEENLQPLTKVLYSLEEVFHSQNNLNDANKAYYYRKLMELEDTRLMKHVDTSKKITFLQRAWNEVEWYSWGLPCGYATSWKKIVFCCSLFYLFFVILYSTGGKLTKTYQEEEDEFRMRLFVLPIKYLFHESEVDFVPNEYVIDHKKGCGKFIGALKFSMVIFFKIGYIDTKISGRILGLDAKYFVWAEWVIGYWLLAALVVTLSNTLPIVHRLISGIF